MRDAQPMNRTGLLVSPHGGRMRENAELEPEGDAGEMLRFRAMLLADAPGIGSIPPPISVAAAAGHATAGVGILVDKIAERLAFERTGTRLYDTLLLKYQATGGFEGGPDLDDLMRHRDEELAHVQILSDAIERLGGDPTAVTPSADLTSVASSGVVAVIADARTSFPQCLEAILVAELVDADGWGRLIELAAQFEHPELVELFQQCAQSETEHLRGVRDWLAAGTTSFLAALNDEGDHASRP
jgi:hypothetical protein